MACKAKGEAKRKGKRGESRGKELCAAYQLGREVGYWQGQDNLRQQIVGMIERLEWNARAEALRLGSFEWEFALGTLKELRHQVESETKSQPQIKEEPKV